MLGTYKAWRRRRQWRRYWHQAYLGRSWDEQCPHCRLWYRGDHMTASFRLTGNYWTFVCRCRGEATFYVGSPKARLLHAERQGVITYPPQLLTRGYPNVQLV